MTRYVLVSDPSLAHEYNNFPLLDFLPCAPSGIVPRQLYDFLKGRAPPSDRGRAVLAPYALRKLEAALLKEHRPEELAVAHVDYVEHFVREETELIGVYTMDPLGLGPLTMSYAILFGDGSKPWVRIQFEDLIRRLNRARRGTRAKLVVGGPGVWEFTMMPEAMDKLGIDLAFQGEADDIANQLFHDMANGNVYDGAYFRGFQSFDDHFRKIWVAHDKFLTRRMGWKQYPALQEIPLIRAPTIKGMTEVMRGCGVGCDFCEVTLRPLRYYPPEMVKEEVYVNVKAGQRRAWMHSDEIFAYKHGSHFRPNAEALKELFRAVVGVKGMSYANPTHGRISIPAAYPELIKELSQILKAGPGRWIGIQVGLETGSDRLAAIHMPNKTLPLKIGSDGSWSEIVTEGTRNFNRYYWRPAFTVQVGQAEETEEDDWETVELVNRMSEMRVDGRPLEFTVTPMQNVPLGLMKSRSFSTGLLKGSQLAVYYACYRQLAKIVKRKAVRDTKGSLLSRFLMPSVLNLGAMGLLRYIEALCKRRGLDVGKVKRYGLAS